MTDVDPLISAELERMIPLPTMGRADWTDVLQRAGVTRGRRRTVTSSRFALAGVVATLAVATAATIVFVGGKHTPPTKRGANGVVIPAPKPIALSDAAAAIGTPVVLPDSPLVSPSDATAIEQCYPTNADPCGVYVNFSTGLRIIYWRNTSSNPLADYQEEISANTNGEIVYISGVPALLYTPVPNDPSSPTGLVQFVAGGTRVRIIGFNSPYDTATVESLAKSIIDQANATG
jgi:hypothetical protein